MTRKCFLAIIRNSFKWKPVLLKLFEIIENIWRFLESNAIWQISFAQTGKRYEAVTGGK